MYGICVWLLTSGVLWLLLHYLMRPVGEFGDTMHPFEPWSMKLHGAGAMLGLFFIGSLLNLHIRRALKARRNLASGWAIIGVQAILTISGYGLYYLASEQSRPIWSVLHWGVGLAFPIVMIVHVALGRKAVSRRRPACVASSVRAGTARDRSTLVLRW